MSDEDGRVLSVGVLDVDEKQSPVESVSAGVLRYKSVNPTFVIQLSWRKK